MWGLTLSRNVDHVAIAKRKAPEMHGSIQLIVATESDRMRQHEAAHRRSTSRSRFGGLAARFSRRGVAAARDIPPRAAPGTDTRPLGHPSAAPARGR